MDANKEKSSSGAPAASGQEAVCPFKLDLEPMEESLRRERTERINSLRSKLPTSQEREESILNEITTWDAMRCAKEFVIAVRCLEEQVHPSLCRTEKRKLEDCAQHY